MPTTDITIAPATFATTGANCTTTGRSFDAIFGMAFQLLRSLMKEAKSGMIGEICVMTDGSVASVGGGKAKFGLTSREAGLSEPASLFMRIGCAGA